MAKRIEKRLRQTKTVLTKQQMDDFAQLQLVLIRQTASDA